MKTYRDNQTTVLFTDAITGLRSLEEKSVHCAITSPPYLGLRSYLDSDHADKSRELGSEETPEQYVEKLVEVFREVWRVLRDDGTLWLNLGSSFASRKMQSDEYVLCDDLTSEELAYVYGELSKHFEAESETLPEVREAETSAEQDVPGVLRQEARTPSKLRREGV